MHPDELRAKIRDIKDFPTEGILFADVTTPLKDARPPGTWATSCPNATSTNQSRWWRRWSRATSVLSQPRASRLWPARYGAFAIVLASAPQSGWSERARFDLLATPTRG